MLGHESWHLFRTENKTIGIVTTNRTENTIIFVNRRTTVETDWKMHNACDWPRCQTQRELDHTRLRRQETWLTSHSQSNGSTCDVLTSDLQRQPSCTTSSAFHHPHTSCCRLCLTGPPITDLLQVKLGVPITYFLKMFGDCWSRFFCSGDPYSNPNNSTEALNSKSVKTISECPLLVQSYKQISKWILFITSYNHSLSKCLNVEVHSVFTAAWAKLMLQACTCKPTWI